MRYRIWDKQSPVNGVPAEKFLSMMGYTPEQEVYIIENDDGTAWIVRRLIWMLCSERYRSASWNHCRRITRGRRR